MVLMGAGMLATYYFLTLYMQLVKGYMPVRTGLVYLPMALATVLGSGLLAPKLLERFSVRTVTVIGMLLAAASMVWFGQLAVDQSPWTVLIPAQVVSGVGIGLGFVTLTIAGVRGVLAHHTGIASGVINAATQIGGALGLAVLATIAAAVTGNVSSGTPPPVALTDGYTTALVIGGALFLAALLVATLTLNPTSDLDADRSPNRTNIKEST
jgi:MFS family permease